MSRLTRTVTFPKVDHRVITRDENGNMIYVAEPKQYENNPQVNWYHVHENGAHSLIERGSVEWWKLEDEYLLTLGAK